MIHFFFYYRAGKIYFYAVNLLGTQIYLFVFLSEWKTGPQNQSARPIEKWLQALLFIFYYQNKICNFYF